MENFEIEFLDHVAIRVKDMEASINWYQNIFGFKKYKLEKWGEYPVFLMAGKSGIAMFPANAKDPEVMEFSKNVKIDHFAFNVTNTNFKKARAKYEQLGLDYIFKDHHYFHSIYIKDLDGHTVELTTLVVDEKSFY